MNECRQELTKEDFAKEEKGTLLEKNETEEVMDCIQHPGQYGGWGIDQRHYFTKRLSAQYPNEIVELYWKETAFYVKMGKEVNWMNKVFADTGWEDYVYWQTEDRKTLRKINQLINDIVRNGNEGIGKQNR